MSRNQTLGDKAAFRMENVRNAETVSVGRGTPLVYSLNGTEDGFAVVLPSTAGADKSMKFLAGVAVDDIAAGQIGQVQCYALCRGVKITRETRSAVTGGASWSSVTDLSIGSFLSLDTVNNAFLTMPATVNVPATDSTALSLNNYYAWLAETVASVSASATATSDTRTALTVLAKAYIRML